MSSTRSIAAIDRDSPAVFERMAHVVRSGIKAMVEADEGIGSRNAR